MSFFDTEICYIKGVGPKRAEILQKMKISDVYDLLHFYPRTYLDFSRTKKIKDLSPDEVCCVRAKIGYTPVAHEYRPKMMLYKTEIFDDTGGMELAIWNNRYAAESVEPGREYLFLGKVTRNRYSYSVANPVILPADGDAGLKPIYRQSGKMRSTNIEKYVANALLKLRTETDLTDPIPRAVREKHKLCHEQYALQKIHFPLSSEELDIARRRLIFEELFVLQAGLMMIRSGSREKNNFCVKERHLNEFLSSLPFTLTSAQRRVIDECLTDMSSPYPMNRLIQGDVGSGKTVVSAALINEVCRSGLQCAVLVPTEILAKQHADTLYSMLPGINTALLTGSTSAKEKRIIKEKLKSGEIQLVVGTHALLTEDTEFDDLALVVTDEQHRFGVRQRSSMYCKGHAPHMLFMSATPIPRTLSIVIYGEMEISTIDELPPGRKKIKTYAVDSSYRKRIYDFIKKHLDSGRQAYIVCPMVDENDETELVAAKKYASDLKDRVFSSYNVGLLHGKMKGKEKKAVMGDFAGGKIQLLVSTTVIEVGVDVPNAVIMVIENANMFGLSQLHQLRGRIGRGSDESYCILISDAQNEPALQRLEIMCRTDNGFEIAKFDLQMRGPGEFFGSKQSGLPEMRIASLLDDMELLKSSGESARAVIKKDPRLQSAENAGLKYAIGRLLREYSPEELN